MNQSDPSPEQKFQSLWESLRDFLDDLQRTFFLGAAGLAIIKFSDRLFPLATWFPKAVGFLLLLGASVLALLFGGGMFLHRNSASLKGRKGVVATTVIVSVVALLFWASMWAAAVSLK